MPAWSAILEKDGRPHTFLGRVFDALEDRQRGCNFLLAGVEAYPEHPGFQFVNQAPVWMSGEELTCMVRREDFQWVWGALLAFSPAIEKEAAISGVRALCGAHAPDLDSWHIRDRFLETGAEFMIYAQDSTFTELLTRDRALLDLFCSHEPQAKAGEL